MTISRKTSTVTSILYTELSATFTMSRVFVFLAFIITSAIAVSGHGRKGNYCHDKMFETIQKMLGYRGRCAYRERTDHHLAAFSAVLSRSLTTTKSQKVIFDKILTNYGNAYKDGVFTCPTNGLYVFDWTVLTAANKVGTACLAVNGKFVKYGGYATGPSRTYASASSSAVLQLKKEDKVWIYTHPKQHIHSTHSSFQGWLLREL